MPIILSPQRSSVDLSPRSEEEPAPTPRPSLRKRHSERLPALSLASVDAPTPRAPDAAPYARTPSGSSRRTTKTMSRRNSDPGPRDAAASDGAAADGASDAPADADAVAQSAPSLKARFANLVFSMETETMRDERRLRVIHDVYTHANVRGYVSPFTLTNPDDDGAFHPGAATQPTRSWGRLERLATTKEENEEEEEEEEEEEGSEKKPKPIEPKPIEPKPPPPFRSKTVRLTAAARATSNKSVDDDRGEVFGEAVRLFRGRVWIFFEDPHSSRLAFACAVFILLLIVLSSVTFCLETTHEFEDNSRRKFELFVVECVCIGIFTLEYLLRISSTPDVKKFMKDPMNAIDLIAILPFYVGLIFTGSGLNSSRMFRTVRLVRVFRVMKLGRHNRKFTVVTNSLRQSVDMLAMMIFLLAMTVIIFSTMIYFAEKGSYYEDEDVYSRKTDISCDGTNGNQLFASDGKTLASGCERTQSPFKSIWHSFWWTIVTIMTVGYGDVVPINPEGKFVASCAMVVSLLLLALPIAVIGTEFTQQWMEYKREEADATSRGTRRKLAPKFLELKEMAKDHLTTLDETLRAMREVQTDIDDRILRVRARLKLKVQEQQTLKRKALAKGADVVANLLEAKREEASTGTDEMLDLEMQKLCEERERLRRCAENAARLSTGYGFPEDVQILADKYRLMDELRYDDYEIIANEIDLLHFEALRWQRETHSRESEVVAGGEEPDLGTSGAENETVTLSVGGTRQ